MQTQRLLAIATRLMESAGHFFRTFVSKESESRAHGAAFQAAVDAVNGLAPRDPVIGQQPSVSVIVPVHNQLAFTLRCVYSLLQHETQYRFEVLLIDDCSSDFTAKMLPRVHGIRYFRNEKNLGFLQSCNQAVRRARGEYLVLLNNDTQVVDGWLDELIGTFERDSTAGLVGSQLLYPDGRLQEAGGIIWNDATGHNYGRGDDPNRPEYNYLCEVDYCSGASIAVRRAVWDALGGFDEQFSPAYYEDTDLAFRVKEAGFKVLCQPLSRVFHFEGMSHGTDESQGGKSHQPANAVKFRAKHHQRLCRHDLSGSTLERQRDRARAGRILFIDHVTPTPDQDAGSLLAVDFMCRARGLGYKISFLPDNMAQCGNYTADLQRVGIECIYHPYIDSVEDYLRRTGHEFDAVVIFRAPTALKHLESLKRHAPQARFIFHTVDLHYLRTEREAAFKPGAPADPDAILMRPRELSVALAADCTVVVSEFEQALLARELPTVQTHCFPWGMNATNSPAPFEGRSDIMFVGGYNHHPNVDAVQYFARAIFPAIRKRLPGVRFLVVGSNPSADVHAVAADDIVVVGFVADLVENVSRCRLTVAPLRYGAGVKGKVLFSLSQGTPCVASPIAAEGVDINDGEELLIADDPVEFAEAVVRLYNDRKLWQSIADRGLQFVRSNYSAEASRSHVRAILDKAGVPIAALPGEMARAA